MSERAIEYGMLFSFLCSSRFSQAIMALLILVV